MKIEIYNSTGQMEVIKLSLSLCLLLYTKFQRMNPETTHDEIARAMLEVFDWGFEQRGLEINFTVRELKQESLNWVYKIFPEDADEEEEYLANGDPEEIKVKYVMYHCLMEMWYVFNRWGVNHKEFIFGKVMRGKVRGWVGCENANDDLDPNANPIRNIDYFMKFSKEMFDCVGL